MSAAERRRWVRISQHAFRRARERFPSLRRAGRSRVNRILVAIAVNGELFGESVLDSDHYRRGIIYPDTPLIVSLRKDRQSPDQLVVTTVLTEEEALNAGPFRRADG